jgi:hypothetical protein
MKKSKITKSNSPNMILRQISRDIELERNNGQFISVNKIYKNKKKYNRKDEKRKLNQINFLLSFNMNPYHAFDPIDDFSMLHWTLNEIHLQHNE